MSEPLIHISKKQALYFAGFLVFYEFLTFMTNDMIMPGMLQVVGTFHASLAEIPKSLSMYVLGGASLQLFLGPLSDRIGRRPVMIMGAVLFLLCTIAIGSSQTMSQFIAARFFQGMGLCFAGVVGYATIQEMFPEMESVRLISLMANVSIMAPLVGPLAGAVFVHYYSWRLIFVMTGVAAVLALWGLWRFMPETVGEIKRDGSKIEVTSLSFKQILANYKQLLLNKVFVFGAVAMGFLWVPCLAWIALSPIIVVEQAHLSLIEYGILQIPVFGAAALGNFVLRRMTHHISLRKLMQLGGSFVAAGLLLLILLPTQFGSNYAWLMPGIIVFFFGMGIVNGPLSRFVLFSTSVSKGTASAVMSLFSMCIPGIAIQVFGALYNKQHSNVVFVEACFVAGIIFLLMLTASLTTESRQPAQTTLG